MVYNMEMIKKPENIWHKPTKWVDTSKGNVWWVIDIFTWGCDSLVKEPSTPGNELPAWYISLTGWCYSGATWDCNSSNSLISHEPLAHIRQLSVNVSTWLKSSCRVLTAGWLTELIPPFTLQRQTEVKPPLQIWVSFHINFVMSPRTVSLCHFYRLVGFLVTGDITGVVVVTHVCCAMALRVRLVWHYLKEYFRF